MRPPSVEYTRDPPGDRDESRTCVLLVRWQHTIVTLAPHRTGSPCIPMPPTDPDSAIRPDSMSPFTPLALPAFRLLWFTWLAANLSMWMNDVAAAWTMTSVPTSLLLAAAVGVSAVLLANRLMVNTSLEEDQTPLRQFTTPVAESPPPSGHMVVSIAYQIDPARADDFRSLMHISRSSRLRHGVLLWELLRDIHEPGRFVEQFVDPSWNEHLRRFERLTAADAALRDRRLGFHIGESPPRVTRCVVESTIRD